MKVAKITARIVAVICGIAALAMFFCPIVTIIGNETFELSGFQLAFGMKATSWSNNTVDLYVSAYYTFAFLTVAFSAVMACLSFKKDGYMVSSFVSSIISAILVLLFRFNTPGSYVDFRPITGSTVNTREYHPLFFTLLFVLVLASVVLFAVSILVSDYVAVLESKGSKKTIFARFISFIREYKSEIKKIIWPGASTVLKNTIVVLVMCAIVGLLIFLLDSGLVWILDSILKLKS